jgi:RimJ/RimL family protein N-acetyltransferase
MPAATLEDVVRAIERWQAGWHDAGPVRHWGIWVEDGAVLAGGVELRVRDDRRANLSYVVFPAHRRRGVATAAVTLATTWGVEHLDIDGVVAIINQKHVASRGVVTGAGFVLDRRAEPWEHTESGVMLRYVLRS